ncbi:SDR family NAD(P)-dependent oxidoreductase [Fulvimarina endophytica]|uniref:SDR family NAD(P)-dependent oxidoreductase n=1 Tax=Fulvimarina endophytica TaxID=2293836 RepID=A0A371X193_9HYPH|nr:SDR family NAD(P)-dependent oxidoreductase [Fulvimarina endophytica]RFC62804.1 SDR family NAD(P)-dependent oxidoreductase [Fulvimarina endophytica]
MTKRSLVIGASGGIGAALADRCREDGEVVTLSRSRNGLDVTDERSIERVFSTIEGPFDRVLIAIGILTAERETPEKKVSECEAAELAQLFTVNAIGPLLVLKHLLPHLPREHPVRIGVLSARVGSIGDNGLGGWYAYRASKAALNQYVRSFAIEMQRSHDDAAVLALHPGTVATPFTAKFQGRHKTVEPDEAARNIVAVLDAHGPGDTGRFFDQNDEPIEW